MLSPTFKAFEDQTYLNIETYRRNGTGVRTPVWFAEHDGTLYAYSLKNAGKVKRIRNNSRVKIVPCSISGVPNGDWIDAKARIVGEEEASLGHHLLNKKYKLKWIGDLFGKLRRREHAVIAIEAD